MEPILIGVTDRTTLVYIPDPASTDGSGKTGLVAANLTVSFTRVETDNDVVVTDATGSLNDVTLTAAHSDWGWCEVSNTVAPGLYRLDLADEVFASGAWMAVVYVMITTSAAAATPKAYQLVAYNPLDSVRLGLTALPNAAPQAAGGLITSAAGSFNVDTQLGTDIDAILADTNELQTDWANGGRLDLILDSRASQTSVDTIDDFLDGEIAAILAAVDTEVAAIKAKTDSLTFTVATMVDCNVQAINDTTVLGDGGATPWGP